MVHQCLGVRHRLAAILDHLVLVGKIICLGQEEHLGTIARLDATVSLGCAVPPDTTCRLDRSVRLDRSGNLVRLDTTVSLGRTVRPDTTIRLGRSVRLDLTVSPGSLLRLDTTASLGRIVLIGRASLTPHTGAGMEIGGLTATLAGRPTRTNPVGQPILIGLTPPTTIRPGNMTNIHAGGTVMVPMALGHGKLNFLVPARPVLNCFYDSLTYLPTSMLGQIRKLLYS